MVILGKQTEPIKQLDPVHSTHPEVGQINAASSVQKLAGFNSCSVKTGAIFLRIR